MVLVLYRTHLGYMIFTKDSANSVTFGLWNHIVIFFFLGNPQEFVKSPFFSERENQCSFHVHIFV